MIKICFLWQSSSSVKSSILDTKENIDPKALALKTHVIAEALAASIYNVSGIGTSFSGSLVCDDYFVFNLLKVG